MHLSSHLMQDPRSFEIHGAISVKLEGFGNGFVLLLRGDGITSYY